MEAARFIVPDATEMVVYFPTDLADYLWTARQRWIDQGNNPDRFFAFSYELNGQRHNLTVEQFLGLLEDSK